MRFSISDAKTALQDPYFLLREFNSFIYRQGYRWEYNKRGIDIFDQDWDNLIILDACRYDAFRDHAAPELPGRLETRTSRAAATPEFIRGNFSNRDLHDVVYVTGSSWIYKLGDEVDCELHDVIDAKNDFDYDQSYQMEQARTAAEAYPNKRLLIHFIPPHHPFQGPLAEKHLPPIEEQSSEFFDKLRRGEIDIDRATLWQIYLENLDRILPRVKELLEELPGKTVVSADHGELFGERCGTVPIRAWGHPIGFYADPLVTVPWHVHENGERKEIIEEEPDDDHIDSRSAAEIDQHLRDLGYKV